MRGAPEEEPVAARIDLANALSRLGHEALARGLGQARDGQAMARARVETPTNGALPVSIW